MLRNRTLNKRTPPCEGGDFFNEVVRLERDDFSSNRDLALSFCLSMISAQTRSARVS